MNKVIIIGCGNVGMSYAFSLLNQNTNVNELVLIDINKDRIVGEQWMIYRFAANQSHQFYTYGLT